MKQISIADVLKMPVAERLLLVEDIWDSIAVCPDEVPVTDAQKKLLDERLEAYHKNPELGSPWAEVKERIRS